MRPPPRDSDFSRAVRERLRTALGAHPDWAREIADGVLEVVDDRPATLANDLGLADPADTTNRLASLWRRGGSRGTPLGTVDGPEGQRIDVTDDLHASALFREGIEPFEREPDPTRRRAIKATLKTLLDLAEPGERGARLVGTTTSGHASAATRKRPSMRTWWPSSAAAPITATSCRMCGVPAVPIGPASVA
jgi:hypothetical protein